MTCPDGLRGIGRDDLQRTGDGAVDSSRQGLCDTRNRSLSGASPPIRDVDMLGTV